MICVAMLKSQHNGITCISNNSERWNTVEKGHLYMMSWRRLKTHLILPGLQPMLWSVKGKLAGSIQHFTLSSVL